MTKKNYLGPNAIITAKQNYLIPCLYHFYRDPPQIVRGKGMYLYDSNGKKYMDLYAGVSVNALGHCHPELTAAICKQVKTLQHTTTIYLTEPIVKLAEKLVAFLPGKIGKSFFCASGSEAVEGAALLASLYTGRDGFVAFNEALHGRTKLGMSLTGLPFWRTDSYPVTNITHVPAPHCLRCPVGKKSSSCKLACLELVKKAVAARKNKPAAMLVEPILGNGGIIKPAGKYMRKLHKWLQKEGILLLADETQTGFGRTGYSFACESWQTTPEIIAGGKALGGGTPIGFFSTTDKIAASYTRPGASTFGGNPVTATAALSFLKVLQREKLVNRTRTLGKFCRKKLTGMAKRCASIEDIRGRGLMFGLELKSAGGHQQAELTDLVLEEMLEKGFLLGKTGADRNVLTLMPPLIISEAELAQALEALEKTLLTKIH